MGGAPLKINMFGRLSIQQDGRQISHFRTKETGLLLACLAQEPERSYRREELIDRIWPEHEPEAGRNCLRIALSHLRQQLESEAGEGGSLLIADRREVRLQPGGYTTDKAEFEDNLRRATQARDDTARIHYLQAATEQYQADLLPEYGDVLITAERQRLSDAYILALRRLVKTYINVKEFDRALETAQKAVKADPQREESHRLLMQVFALAGRPAAAVRQYRELESLLDSTLGITPSRPTQTVMTKVCEQVGITVPQPPPAARPSALAPSAESPLSRRLAAPLPVPLTRLFGRADDIGQVLEMLGTPETRLVSLVGMGGVGKTRLALAVAQQVQNEGKQTVCFIPLEGLTRPELLLATLAAHLQVPLTPRQDLQKRIHNVLAAEPFLLILDNLEQLLPEGAAVLERLLEAVETLTCLVTSRQRLNVAGEYSFPVRPLPLVSRTDDPAELETCPSMQLWLDRARAISPSFQVTAANRKDVLALNRLLEGVPLAVELSAAWIGMLTPAQIVSRLSARFDLLVSRRPGIESRHASLRAALDWSYQLMSAAVQRFFARLGLFRGGWSLEAAEEVCDEPQTLEYLAQLCERSLVSVEETPSGMRYRYLETVREYADGCLIGEARTAAERRFCAYFLRMVEEAEAGFKGPEQVEWMQRLKVEEDNVRAVLKQVVGDAEAPERALGLTVALFRYWYIRGDSHEGRSWISAALDNAPADTPTRSRALMALGNLAYGDGDYSSAEAHFARCRDLRSAAGDAVGLASTLGSLGNAAHRLGDLPRARALLLQSLQIFQDEGHQRGQALTHGNLATLALDAGDACEALSQAQDALVQFRELGDTYNIMLALNNAGSALLRLGDDSRARANLADSLELCLQLESTRDLARILAGAATVARRSGEEDAALQLLGASARIRSDESVRLSSRCQDEVDTERKGLADILGESETDKQWNHGYHLSEDAMTVLARRILSAKES